MSPSIPMLGVVGAGIMGAGIIEVGLRAGCTVIATDPYPSARERASQEIASRLAHAIQKGRLSGQVEEFLQRLTWADDIDEFRSCTVVVEAIREVSAEKIELFLALDDVVSAETILASNTSSIPIAQLARSTRHPERVIGMHFFNPAPSMPLVEVIPSLLTAPAIAERTEVFVREVLGKQSIRAQDRAGFVVNAILVPYLLSAIRALQNGVATAQDIDAGMVGGCNMPMGPLRLADLIGLDTLLLIATSMHAETLDPADTSPPLLRRYVDAGWLGRKSGRGFFDYASAH